MATDDRPENLHYRDTGCEESPPPVGCLGCPLPACKHDLEAGQWHRLLRARR